MRFNYFILLQEQKYIIKSFPDRNSFWHIQSEWQLFMVEFSKYLTQSADSKCEMVRWFLHKQGAQAKTFFREKITLEIALTWP